MNPTIELEKHYCAQNYTPLPVVLVKGDGIYAWDDQGKRYLDMMSAYSAVSHGHCHPRLVKVLTEQAKTLAIISRAYYSDKLGIFLQKICELTKQDKALPMNTGAEAVETATKAARKWAYIVKGVAENKAEIIVCEGNFHGRTIAMIAMSSNANYKFGFGPFPTGFKIIPYGNSDALENAINKNTAAFLVEPIQGEGGIRIPPVGYLKKCADICKKHNVLLLCDEIQTGLGRTGKFLACEHEGVQPDGLTLGKALGGGLLPVSMFLAKREVMDVFKPGDHGSTFGGYSLAARVGLEALTIIEEEKFVENSAILGEYFLKELKKIDSAMIKDVRGKGLFIGLEINSQYADAKQVCLKFLDHGLLTRETQQTIIRLAPPLIINKDQIDVALEIIKKVLSIYTHGV